MIDFDDDKSVLVVTVGGTRRSFTKAELVAALEGADLQKPVVRGVAAGGKAPWVARLAATVREATRERPIPPAEQRRLAGILDATQELEPVRTTSRLAATLEELTATAAATEPALVQAIAAFVKRYPGLR